MTRYVSLAGRRRISALVSVVAFSAFSGPLHATVISAGDIQTPPGSYVVGDSGAGTLDVSDGSLFVPAPNVVFGFGASGSGIGSVDGPGSQLGATGIFELGKSGTGSLDMSNRAALTSFDIFLGTEAGSSGTLNAINNGATIDAGNRIMVGGAGTGTMTLIDNLVNAPVVTSTYAEVGNGGTGMLTMTGPGTQWMNNDTLFVGQGSGATGTVNMDFGSTFFAGGQIVFGNDTGGGATGALNMTNGASLTGGSDFVLGNGENGTGTLNATNGAGVHAAGTVIVGSSGATGTAILSGGAHLGSGSLTIVGYGDSAHGTVAATGNADLFAGHNLAIGAGSGAALIGGVAATPGSFATGHVSAIGTGSSVNGTFATVGETGHGTLAIRDDARGSLVGVTVGDALGADGTVDVSGQNARLLLQGQSGMRDAFMIVGREGRGNLNVLDGGRVIVDPQAAPVGPDNAGALLNIGGTGSSASGLGDGTVNVSGTDGVGGRSRIVLQGERAVMNVGRQGSGVLNVADGALVRLSNPDGQSATSIGRDVNSTGLVNVQTGGELQFGQQLNVGQSATGGGGTAGGTLNVTNSGIVRGGPAGGGNVTVALNAGSTGLLNVANGGLLVADTVQVNAGGTLAGGGGTIQADVTVHGTLAPGNSPGIMEVLGSLTLGGASLTLIELGGTLAGQFDQVNVFDNPLTAAVEGTAFVSGTVDVTWFGGFTAALGDFFDIFTADDIVLDTAVFVLPGLAEGLVWETGVVTLETGREALRLSLASTTVAEVSEPAALAILVAGLAGLALFRRRRAA